MEQKALTHGIKFKDKVGYALGDAGGLLTFSLIGAFQNKFYTDALGIKPQSIILLILIARIWDAINDPLWGAFVQSIISFVLIALVVFLLIKGINAMRRKKEEEPEPEAPAGPTAEELLADIKGILEKQAEK